MSDNEIIQRIKTQGAIEELVRLKEKFIIDWVINEKYFAIDAINERLIELHSELKED